MNLFALSSVLVACGNTALAIVFSLIIQTRVRAELECVTYMLI